MERSEIQGVLPQAARFPDCASLHPGYSSPLQHHLICAPRPAPAPLLPRTSHRLRQLHPLLVPPALLCLGTPIERSALRVDRLRPLLVLPPRLVQRPLCTRDRFLAARALLGASDLLLAALGFPPALFLRERRGGLARLLIVDLAGWLLCSL